MKMLKLLLTAALLFLQSTAGGAQDIPLEELIRLGTVAAGLGETQIALGYLGAAVEDSAFKNLSDSERSRVLASFGQVLINMDRYDEAEKVLDRSLEIQRRNLGGDPENLPLILSYLGMVYQATGRYGPSETVLEEARHLIDQQSEASPSILVQVLNNLGTLYLATGRSDAGERTLKEALALSDTNGDSAGLIAVLNNLARAALQRKKWDRAEALLNRALDVADAARGNQLWMGLTWINLGYVYRGRKDFVAAEDAFRKAIENWKNTFGRESMRVAVASSNLGEALTKLGKYDEAEPLFVHAIAILEGSPRPAAATFAKTLDQYANLLRLQSDQKALALEDRAEDIRSFLRDTVPVEALVPSH